MEPICVAVGGSVDHRFGDANQFVGVHLFSHEFEPKSERGRGTVHRVKGATGVILVEDATNGGPTRADLFSERSDRNFVTLHLLSQRTSELAFQG